MTTQEYSDRINTLHAQGLPLADIIDLLERMEALDKRHAVRLTAKARKQAQQTVRVY